MSLEPGRHLGSFEIVELLGQGGMGEVYRARDTRLHRDVALKVLPDQYALDSQRLARFRREALVLASLVHPRIATLFGIEESGATTALIMELVDGERLDDRIARYRGRGLPLDDALRLAGELADALDAAHRRGVVHRDLKPANIKVNVDESVKVLDFGLASILAPDAHGDVTGERITETSPQAVLGTPAYMSPEQARGEPTDQRADVWAFGCVLYEMLTGRRAFDGRSTVEVLVGVLEREPDLDVLPPDTPPAIRRLLRRTLSKNVRTRLRDMGDARLEINDALARTEDVTPGRRMAAPARVRTKYAAAALAGVALVALFASQWVRPGAVTPPISRFEIEVPPESSLGSGMPTGREIAISRDGSRLALRSGRGFLIRHRDRVSVETLEVGASVATGGPFFSPDGQWVGFTTESALKKVAVTGGAPVEIVKTATYASGAWGGGQIVYADASGLYRVPQEGGTPEKLAVNIAPTEQVAFPEVLPGGRAILFTVLPTRTNVLGAASQSRQARIEALDLRDRKQVTVLRGGGRPRYVPTGHLLFALGGTLHTVLFDTSRLEIRGEPIELIADAGSSQFAVSEEGTLAYVVSGSPLAGELVWVDRRGREEPLGAPLLPYNYPRLSPDGKQVAVDVSGADRDIWIWDLSRKVLERFTSDPAENALLAWTRDGRHLAFGSSRSGVSNVFWQASDRAGEPERLWDSDRLQQPMSFAPDGRLLLSEAVSARGRDILALSLDPPRRLERILESDATEGWAEVSPDGRWIAYESDESGQFEIYVRPYPRIRDGRWRVSATGGRQPLWSPDGRELFYRDFSGALMLVPVTPGPALTFGAHVKLLDGARYLGGGSGLGGRQYDLDPSTSRFLLIKRANPSGNATSVVVTENWFQELQARLPNR